MITDAPRSRSIGAFSGAYKPYATSRASGLIARTRSITGSASRVAVCIGRKNPIAAARRTDSSLSRSFARSAQTTSIPAARSAAAADASPNG